jgi:hypothetical protein
MATTAMTKEPAGEAGDGGMVVRSVSYCMQDAAEREPVVDAHGSLNRDVFEKMVSLPCGS